MLDYALSSSRYKLGEVVAVAQKYKDIALDMPVELAAELIKQPGWNNKMFVKADLMAYMDLNMQRCEQAIKVLED